MLTRTATTVILLVALLGCWVAAGLPDLSGTCAMIQILLQIAVLPLVGEIPRTSIVAQSVDVVQEGATLTMTGRYCFIDVDDGTPLVKTEIPAAFISSVTPGPRTAQLRETEGGIEFKQPIYLEVRGAVLDDPAADPLPTDPFDPRVFDQDGDGRPGMTVRVTILGIVQGETYVVQRVRYRLIGRVIGSDRIEGRIDWIDEQSVLDATNALLKADAMGTPDPDPSAHRFVMVRVDASWTCETLRERLPEILGTDTAG